MTTTASAAQIIAAAMSEADWQEMVIEAATLAGWHSYHTHDSRRSAKGFPDLVLVHPVKERVVFAELKRMGEKPTAAQENWLHALTLAGQEVYVWRPNDLPAVLCILGLEGS